MDPKTAANKLRQYGLSDQAIATIVGSTQSTINRIRLKERYAVEWSLGQRLIQQEAKRRPRVNGK